MYFKTKQNKNVKITRIPILITISKTVSVRVIKTCNVSGMMSKQTQMNYKKGLNAPS